MLFDYLVVVLKPHQEKIWVCPQLEFSANSLHLTLSVCGSFRAQEEIGFCTFLSKFFHGFPGYIEASFPNNLRRCIPLLLILRQVE